MLMHPCTSELTLALILVQAPAPPAGYQSNLGALYTQNAAARPVKKTTRVLPQQPERVLDAPELLDNYYLNLLDWGSNNQVGLCWPSCHSLHQASLHMSVTQPRSSRKFLSCMAPGSLP